MDVSWLHTDRDSQLLAPFATAVSWACIKIDAHTAEQSVWATITSPTKRGYHTTPKVVELLSEKFVCVGIAHNGAGSRKDAE